MSLLTELVTFYVTVFYKDFAPTELVAFALLFLQGFRSYGAGLVFSARGYKDFAPMELFFRSA